MRFYSVLIVLFCLSAAISAADKWHFLMNNGDQLLYAQIVEVGDDSVTIKQRHGKTAIAIDEIAVLRKENRERSILPLSGCLAGCVAGGVFGFEKANRQRTVLTDFDDIAGSAFLGAAGGLAVAVALASKIDFRKGTDFRKFAPDERRQHLQAIVKLNSFRQ